MNTPIVAINRALSRHKSPVVLIVIELSLLMAILCNTMFLVARYVNVAGTPTGVDEDNIAVVQRIGLVGVPESERFLDTIHAMESLPGVVHAALGVVPFWGAHHSDIFLKRDQSAPTATASAFFGSQNFDKVLGLKVVSGHVPEDLELPKVTEINEHTSFPIMVTQALASRLFPDNKQAVGQTIYITNDFLGVVAAQIIGVIPHLRETLTGNDSDDYSYVLQVYYTNQDVGGGYVLRSEPGRMSDLLQEVQSTLDRAQADHVIGFASTVHQLRVDQLAATRANIWTLVIVLSTLLLVTIFGLIALTSFWVQHRRTQIAVRRALGATRGNILHYYQVENALIVGMGTTVGVALAWVLNTLLVQFYALPRMPIVYFLWGAAILLVVGQFAAFGPAMRAASVPPANAFRL